MSSVLEIQLNYCTFFYMLENGACVFFYGDLILNYGILGCLKTILRFKKLTCL